MNFYIASGLHDAAQVRDLAARLTALGHHQTYDWTVHGSVADQYETEVAVKTALAELQGVLSADFVVVLLKGGYGTHVELGAALAKNLPIFLIGKKEDWIGPDGYPCIFYRHPLIEAFDSVDALMDSASIRLSKHGIIRFHEVNRG